MEKPLEFFASPDRNDPKLKSFLDDACSNLCDWFATTKVRGPLPSFSELPEVPPSLEGASAAELLDDLQLLMAGSYQPSHPGSLAHLDPPPLTASIVGELISAGLNNNLLAEELSPSITKLERSLCKWMACKIGMPESAGGVATSGGSLANLMALLVARSRAQLSYDSHAVVLASAEAHVSLSRAISIMGLPPDALLRISTDDDGRMTIESLREQYSKIKEQGKKCFAVIATAGTTIRGAIDPLIEISEFCTHEGLWFHVDAAIGGVFALAESTKQLVSKLSSANSITINPQKLLGITKTSSLLLVANNEDLFNSFSTGFPYLEPSCGNDFQGGELGIQGTRPAEVLKLWLGLRQLGHNGIKFLLENAISRRRYLEESIDCTKLRIITGPLHLIAVTPVNSADKVAEEWSIATKAKLLEHNFMLSRPQYKDRNYLKAVMGNPHTKLSHINQLSEILNQSI